MKLLFAVNESIGTTRPDVAVLFGRDAAELGLTTDLCGLRDDPGPSTARAWAGGKAFGCRRTRFGPFNQIIRTLTACRVFWMDLSNYDALQVRDRPLTACLWLLAARLRGRPFFYWMSFPEDLGYRLFAARSRGLRRGYYRLKAALMGALLYRVVMPRADHLFVQSERLKTMVAERCPRVPLDRMTSAPMGVDLDQVDRLTRRPPAARPFDGRKTLAYLGTMDPIRDLDFLIDVLAALRLKAGLDVALLMIGDTEVPGETARLKAYADACGVADAVHWTGWMGMVDAWAMLRSANLALSMIPPAFDFSSPTKALEYMAVGVPAVASREIDDQREALEQSGAGLAVPYTVDACVEAVKTILADDRLAESMVRAGPDYIRRRRSYQVLAERLVERYRQLLSR